MKKVAPTEPSRPNSATANSTRASVLKLTKTVGLSQEDGSRTLEERISYRREHTQEQYQLNIEAILKHAITISQNEIASHELDLDWWHQFQHLAEQIHSPKMQLLWGKILTIELAQPHSFSLKALETLKRMNQRDAQLLLNATALSCTFEQDSNPIIICGYRSAAAVAGFVRGREELLPLTRFGLPYTALLTLRELGLLHAVELETGSLPQRHLTLAFNQQKLSFSPRHSRLHLRYYRFTNAGQELTHLLNEHSQPEYISALALMAPKEIVWL